MHKHLHIDENPFLHLTPPPSNQADFQVERRKAFQNQAPPERIRRIAGTLYEYLSDETDYRFQFAFNHFCSWLLNDNSGGFDSQPPCLRRKDDGYDDKQTTAGRTADGS